MSFRPPPDGLAATGFAATGFAGGSGAGLATTGSLATGTGSFAAGGSVSPGTGSLGRTAGADSAPAAVVVLPGDPVAEPGVWRAPTAVTADGRLLHNEP
mgnify:CR=1 FL=1